MRPPCKRVAVIGGGFSGATTVKALKKEGIEPVCFEKSSEIGGIWCYREKVVTGLPSLMWSTTINHSKELGTFSDFPWPAECPNYFRHFVLYENFKLYVEKFDLLRHIICNREVIRVEKSSDYEETGRWSVTIKNTVNKDITTEVFDAVMICSGFLYIPNLAVYPGMEKFRGKIMHTHSLKKIDDAFEGKNITVIGTGCSAMDAAVETSSVAKQNMRPPCKRAAVIGGGFSGATTVKALKEEGIEPVCFEKSSEIGGLWCYREKVVTGLPSLMWSTTINHSKELGTFSDFPWPAESPNFFRHFVLYENFKLYVEKFDLSRHIICNREVIRVEKSSDYEETGRWSVTIKNTINKDITTEIFDAVMICSGFFYNPNLAVYPGMEKFRGKIMHTHSLKKIDDAFEGKKITVIGTGCSAMDAAVETSSVAKQVYLSTRTPSWIMPRMGPHGLPFDYAFLRRYIIIFQVILTTKVASWIVEHYFLNIKFNHKLYGIEPKYNFLCRDPIVNDHLPAKLLSGAVELRKDVKRFTEDGVVFEGENQETKMDFVIMATGYKIQFSFLEEGIVKMKDGRIDLYKCMYPTQLKHATLAVIGFILPFGASFPLFELQARWAAHLLSRNYSLPSYKLMEQDVTKRYETNSNRFSPSENTTVRVDYVPYMDEIASQFGAKPNFWKMAFTDPKLFIACVFGPCVPFQYRLVGPHKWEGARQAIFTSSDRMQTPLSKEKMKLKQDNEKTSILKNLALPLLVLALLVYSEPPWRYYLAVPIILYYLVSSRYFFKYFAVLILLPFFCNFHGYIAVCIMALCILVFCNLGVMIINRHFWR